METTFLRGNLEETTSDHRLFVKKLSDSDFVILLLYVDDMLMIGHDAAKIEKLKRQLSKSFAMKDLGPTKQIIDMKIIRGKKKKVWLSQENYIEKYSERFNTNKVKHVVYSLAEHFKLFSRQNSTIEKDKQKMKNVPSIPNG